MGTASLSPLSPSLSPAHLVSPASPRPRCQSLFTNWLASLCSACRQTHYHCHPTCWAPHCSTPGLKLGTPTPATHLMGIPRAEETHSPQWLGVRRDPTPSTCGNTFLGSSQHHDSLASCSFWDPGDASKGHQLQMQKRGAPRKAKHISSLTLGGQSPSLRGEGRNNDAHARLLQGVPKGHFRDISQSKARL